MKHFKFILIIFISIGVLLGCSKITNIFEEVKNENSTSKGGEDFDGEEPSANDVEFYNKYIEVLNTYVARC